MEEQEFPSANRMNSHIKQIYWYEDEREKRKFLFYDGHEAITVAHLWHRITNRAVNMKTNPQKSRRELCRRAMTAHNFLLFREEQ